MASLEVGEREKANSNADEAVGHARELFIGSGFRLLQRARDDQRKQAKRRERRITCEARKRAVERMICGEGRNQSSEKGRKQKSSELSEKNGKHGLSRKSPN